jgi:uncharacterized membrane protein YoaT (DUF817 family)
MAADQVSSLERRLGDKARARLPFWAAEFVMFVLKQGWACLFGGLLLVAIILSRAVWPDDAWIARYDFLVVLALAIQVAFLRFGLESWSEARVILLFHATGTAMEIFKISAGSWAYPEAGLLKVMGVPLFSGFMYGAVGSYIARVVRIFHMRFAPFPPIVVLWGLAAAIYVNFFTHHYIFDFRWVLMALTLLIFARTRVWFTVDHHAWWMPMPLAAVLAAFFLWVAENVGTFTGTWIYAKQGAWEMVSLSKLGSWYLLLWVALATVTLVMREMLIRQPLRRGPDQSLMADER